MKPESQGKELIAERVSVAPELVAAMVARPFSARPQDGRRIRRVVATGIGSSEAHARYFCWLLNTFTDVPAQFVPLAEFMAPFGPAAGSTLAVFSQGLSANAAFALRQAERFEHAVVFTAATEEGQRLAGRPDRAGLLAWLRSLGAEVVPFPVEDEYTVLIRLIGPVCGFVAAHQFVEALPGSRLRPLAEAAGKLQEWAAGEAVADLREALTRNWAEWQAGSLLLLPSPLAEFAQNVGCKFVEGLFWTAPTVVELMQFAHGPFQQLARTPRPVCLVEGGRAGDRRLAQAAVAMLENIGLRPVLVPLDCPAEHAPIALELMLNPVFRDLIAHFDVNQVEWPGKALDGPIYQLSPPVPAPSVSSS